MRPPRIPRTDPPAEVAERLRMWTNEIRAEYAAWEAAPPDAKPARPTVDDGKYGHQDVRNAIKQLYNGLCCYCEAEVGATSALHVEHYRPKGKVQYLPLAYEWTNLHLACEECNLTKSQKFDETCRPVIPTEDEPLDYIRYELWEVFGKHPRGDWTVAECGLDRDELTETRCSYFRGLFEVISEARRAIRRLQQLGYVPRNSTDRKVVERALRKVSEALQTEAPFKSMVLDNGLDTAAQTLRTTFYTLKFI